jgi:hypothetical protein
LNAITTIGSMTIPPSPAFTVNRNPNAASLPATRSNVSSLSRSMFSKVE